MTTKIVVAPRKRAAPEKPAALMTRTVTSAPMARVAHENSGTCGTCDKSGYHGTSRPVTTETLGPPGATKT